MIGGKYRIERLLGRGGMGTVYAATHVHLNTQVALKFLNPNFLDNAQVVERFMREAHATARLNSEHVCRVMDVDRDGTPFIVMEMLDGTDLSRLIRSRGPLGHETAADYVAQACAGLAEAHAAKIVHRDLKPGNLFLARRGDGSQLVKVLDFGVAKSQAQQDFSLTQTANVVGSPGYMSPEQLRSSKVVDVRTDVWALGVILYELVVGRQPFRAEAITDLALMITLDPTPPLLGVPPKYAAIVNRCLEKSPDKRYPDVMSLAAALVEFVPRSQMVDSVSRMLERSAPNAMSPTARLPIARPYYETAPRPTADFQATLRDSMPPAVMAHAVAPVPTTMHDGPLPMAAGAHAPSTTLAAASGVMLAPQRAPVDASASRSRLLVGGIAAGAIAIGVILGVAVFGGSGGPKAPSSRPAAQSQPAQPEPAVTPIVQAPPAQEPVTPAAAPPQPQVETPPPAVPPPAVPPPAVPPPVTDVAPTPLPAQVTKPPAQPPPPHRPKPPPRDIGDSRI